MYSPYLFITLYTWALCQSMLIGIPGEVCSPERSLQGHLLKEFREHTLQKQKEVKMYSDKLMVLHISSVLSSLLKVINTYNEYQTEKKAALDTYRLTALDDALRAAENGARAAVDKEAQYMQECLDKLMVETKARNNDLTELSEANHTAQLLAASEVDYESVQTVIKPFIGCQPMLRLIAGNASEEGKAMVSGWIFDNIGAVEEIKNNVERMTYESVENLPNYIGVIRLGIQNFAAKMGVDISRFNDLISEIRRKNITALMGFNYSELYEEQINSKL